VSIAGFDSDLSKKTVKTAAGYVMTPWASAHRGKWGQLTPWKMDEKLKSENMRKRAVFGVYVILSEQSGQAGVENGAMLTTYLFRYTSECTIS